MSAEATCYPRHAGGCGVLLFRNWSNLVLKNLAETAEDVSEIAFGFMASKAVFAALHIDVFTHLADGSKTCIQLAEASGVTVNRVITLMTWPPLSTTSAYCCESINASTAFCRSERTFKSLIDSPVNVSMNFSSLLYWLKLAGFQNCCRI